jgi:PAS domain S-box-containing protein
MMYISPAYEAIWGRTCASLLESPRAWLDAVHPEDRQRVTEAALNEQTKGDYDEFYRIVRPDGSIRWIHDKAFPLRNDRGEVYRLVGVAADVTELKRVQWELALREEQYREIFTAVSEGLVIRNWDGGVIVDANPAFYNMLGYTREEIIRLRPEDYVAPDCMSSFKKYIETVRMGSRFRFEGQLMRKDGTVICVDAYCVVLHYNGQPHLLAAVRDVSDKKMLEEQFLRAQRMETIGMLAGGIAHDMNNILAPMLMAAGLLKGKVTAPRDQVIVTIIENGAQRGAAIVRQLLTFSRGLVGAKGIVQVRHLMNEIAHIMRETFPRNIEVELRAPSDLWAVNANATQLHQVLMNLCVNARDAMPNGGRLALKAANKELSETDSDMNPLANPGRYVVIKVADTGQGIPKEVMDRIFEPFFTTKGVGQGTGLGLSTVVSIVKGHGGFVTVSSEPGKGTEFSVFLPADDAHQAEPGEAVPAAPQGHGELILIVDDEASIRETARQVLEANGYRVVAAADGAEALRTFVQLRDLVKLILTDIVMPVMGGADLIRSLRILEPAVKVVVISGTEEGVSHENLESLGVREIVAKPCDAVQLLQAMHRELGA